MKYKTSRFLFISCITFISGFLWNDGAAQQRDSITQSTNVKGLSIAYKRLGNGPTLVLLHGFTQDSRVWKPQIESLSKNFTVIAWDAPGAGLSADPAANFSLGDWADCLAALLDSARIKRAHILGISWGGVLALEFYERHPQYVMSLILADTNAGWRSFGDSIADARLSACMMDASLSPHDLVSKYLPGMLGDSPPEEAREELAKIMFDFHPAGFRLMVKAIAMADMRMFLSKIKIPTLLVWGDSDKRSPLSVAHKLKEEIPGAKLEIISNTGHISNMESPTQFNKIINDFCLQHSDK